jgi:hypothetical protein
MSGDFSRSKPGRGPSSTVVPSGLSNPVGDHGTDGQGAGRGGRRRVHEVQLPSRLAEDEVIDQVPRRLLPPGRGRRRALAAGPPRSAPARCAAGMPGSWIAKGHATTRPRRFANGAAPGARNQGAQEAPRSLPRSSPADSPPAQWPIRRSGRAKRSHPRDASDGCPELAAAHYGMSGAWQKVSSSAAPRTRRSRADRRPPPCRERSRTGPGDVRSPDRAVANPTIRHRSRPRTRVTRQQVRVAHGHPRHPHCARKAGGLPLYHRAAETGGPQNF